MVLGWWKCLSIVILGISSTRMKFTARTSRLGVGKGIGVIYKTKVGEYYFPTAIEGQPDMTGIMTNTETWYGLSSTDTNPLGRSVFLVIKENIKCTDISAN